MARKMVRRTEILRSAASLFATHGYRVSLNEIAQSCDLLPGSLYHHFDSKEAIVVELVKWYQEDLDRIAEKATTELEYPSSVPIQDQIVALATEIAECAIRHRAALLLTVNEPPSGASEELVRVASRAPTAIDAAMLGYLRAGRESGYIRRGIDVGRLAERLCRSMLHVGIGVLHQGAGAEHVPAMKCWILLHGIAANPIESGALDRSEALHTADRAMATWDEQQVEDEDTRFAFLCNVARAEFARRGFEATTMRDIAAAADLSTGTVYKVIGSKADLLQAVMGSFIERGKAAWKSVLDSDSTPIEKLDALMWLDINVLDRFSDEVKILLTWLRQSPPTSPNLGRLYTTQLRQVKTVLSEGARVDEIRLVGATSEIRARSVFDLIAMPETIVRSTGCRAAHALARDTVLRGAAERA